VFNPKKRAAPKNHSKRPGTAPNQAKRASNLKPPKLHDKNKSVLSKSERDENKQSANNVET